MGIANVQTVIICGLSINIYLLFDVKQILMCPYVEIEDTTMQLFNLSIVIENNTTINVTNQSISPEKLYLKHTNGSLIHASNRTQIDKYYFVFSSELVCRFSLSENETTCFYFPASIGYNQVESEFDRIRNSRLVLSNESYHRFTIVFLIIGILVMIVCVFGLYILCSNRLVYHHVNRIDYTIDPHVAKETELKLGPDII